jgi:hypothetical protein
MSANDYWIPLSPFNYSFLKESLKYYNKMNRKKVFNKDRKLFRELIKKY